MKTQTAHVHVELTDDFEGGVIASANATTVALVEAVMNGLIPDAAAEALCERIDEIMTGAYKAVDDGRKFAAALEATVH